MSDPAEVLDLARRVAASAADLVAANRFGVTVAATKSSPVDVVTEVDRASEALIRDLVLGARPDDGFLGEEDGGVAGISGVRWIVDPIDGTVNFLYGLPAYAVSIAAEVDGQVVAGVVRNVASGIEYHAALGQGAWRDDVRLRVRPAPELAQSLVLTGFNYAADVRRIQAAGLAELLPRVRDIRRFGSCALDLCTLAEGGADAYYEEGIATWDHAAGALIAREAGARTELTTGPAGREMLLAAPAEGFEAFREALVECRLIGGNGE
ncbi:inositol monophosphatase family protein [Nocardioides sp. AE5]|uniref:inositol monophosphatase family protein n=1 Tax=Nocardioides sp. AE5 TaxID=2962573 RepID=UPI002882AADE|nr:inositol monophosphatase family protein [Nocardioides sp. AE5]MDT0201379.1 inositol monophosphatase family protein [Nocardioides sp. AE5]